MKIYNFNSIVDNNREIPVFTLGFEPETSTFRAEQVLFVPKVAQSFKQLA